MAKYFECSVSTCNAKRTGYVFCSVPCWERHVPGARHRDASAIEVKAPSQSEARAAEMAESAGSAVGGNRRIIPTSSSPSAKSAPVSKEVLIVVSRLKEFVQLRSEMNTSEAVAGTLSDFVRELCEYAMDNARKDGRKTLMERDFANLRILKS